MVTPMSNPSQSDQPSDPAPSVSQEPVDQKEEMTVAVPKDILLKLGQLAKILNVEPTTALRYAVFVTSDIYSEKNEGATVLLEKGKKRYQVTLKDPRIFARPTFRS
ncbi:hypothetical protein [Leptolyngbya sp. PCC 6406]|uniref:hypothetical protein n=1 Tax=Leptolyngbya sp. PCC 6406 TaxID=1173264 RepID=UPI0002ABEEFD|nr:hypothetical protein [Leptolyngbya sp. PCC 6406]